MSPLLFRVTVCNVYRCIESKLKLMSSVGIGGSSVGRLMVVSVQSSASCSGIVVWYLYDFEGVDNGFSGLLFVL